VRTALLLTASNVFMTFAWYGHLKHLNGKPWWIAALVSWGIALIVFVPFAVLYMGQPTRMNYVYAGVCLFGAAYFIFRG
jgi:hypothetical protein